MYKNEFKCQDPAQTGLYIPGQGRVDQNCQVENTEIKEKDRDTEESWKGNPVNTEFAHVHFPYALSTPI